MRNKISNLIWGLIFIVVGVGLAGNIFFGWNFEVFFDGWWTLFIIIPCLISIVRNGITLGSTGGVLIGVMILVSYYVDFEVSLWDLLVPAILIIVGLGFIFQGAFRKSINVDQSGHAEGQGGAAGYGKRDYSAIFAGNRVRVTDEFLGTSLNAVFGGMTLDLRDAIINRDVEISATAVFGGIDIYVPSGVSVKVNNMPVFGGVSNKAVQNTDPNAYTIYLNSTTMFGGIDIK